MMTHVTTKNNDETKYDFACLGIMKNNLDDLTFVFIHQNLTPHTTLTLFLGKTQFHSENNFR